MNREKSKAIIVSVALALIVCTLLCIIPFLPSGSPAAMQPAVVSQGDESDTGEDILESLGTVTSAADTTGSGITSGNDLPPEETTTSSAAPSTTSSTTGKSTTASSTAATTVSTTEDTRKNAEYVVNPNYESPYYIVVFAGDSQSVAIYSKDSTGAYTVLHKCFTCSTGAKNSPTRTGQYKIRAKYRWRWLVGNVYGQYSSSISSSYLFHSVPYLKQDPSTLDMKEYDKLGTPASHGCIRLCVRDTKWIYDYCPIGTQVNIVNASGPKGDTFPARNTDPIYSGWDPTDLNPDSPYIKTPVTTTETTTETTTTTTSAETTVTSTATETTASSETASSTTQATSATEAAAATTATTAAPDAGGE